MKWIYKASENRVNSWRRGGKGRAKEIYEQRWGWRSVPKKKEILDAYGGMKVKHLKEEKWGRGEKGVLTQAQMLRKYFPYIYKLIVNYSLIGHNSIWCSSNLFASLIYFLKKV